MDEMIHKIKADISSTDIAFYGTINIDDVSGTNRVLRRVTNNPKAALLLMLTDALGLETTKVLNYEAIGINTKLDD